LNRYNITREVNTKGEPQFIVIEQYTNQDAVKVHGSAEPFKAMGRTFRKEGLLAKPLAVLFVKPIGGFDSRGGSKL
jgi:quinol monooxygenase YgiN